MFAVHGAGKSQKLVFAGYCFKYPDDGYEGKRVINQWKNESLSQRGETLQNGLFFIRKDKLIEYKSLHDQVIARHAFAAGCATINPSVNKILHSKK